ncbi:hypothetical protein C8J57DRAFT_1277334, partial [Mycena rebaudengoi]
MASTSESRETCMSLPESVAPGPQSRSFEEVRIADYLTSYRASGRPPQPVPPLPTNAAERAALRLPPLFVPSTFGAILGGGASGSGGGASSSSSGGGAGGRVTPTILDAAQLPLAQAMGGPAMAPEGEALVAICALPEYAHFSNEELRYHAYARGARAPPPGTPMFPFAANFQPLPSSSSSALALPGPGAPGGLAGQGELWQGAKGGQWVGDTGGDTFVTITALPEFAGHSLEELRVAFLRTGTELTSAQLFATSTPPAARSSSTPRRRLRPPR